MKEASDEETVVQEETEISVTTELPTESEYSETTSTELQSTNAKSSRSKSTYTFGSSSTVATNGHDDGSGI